MTKYKNILIYLRLRGVTSNIITAKYQPIIEQSAAAAQNPCVLIEVGGSTIRTFFETNSIEWLGLTGHGAVFFATGLLKKALRIEWLSTHCLFVSIWLTTVNASVLCTNFVKFFCKHFFTQCYYQIYHTLL